MNAPRPPRRWADVQRLIVNVYSLQLVRHFVLRVREPAAARAFLGQLVGKEWITTGSAHELEPGELEQVRDCRTNIGFTFRGLRELGLPERYLSVFHAKSPAFAEGAPVRAARRLGDTGDSAAECWEPSFGLNHAHVLLSVYASTPEVMKTRTAGLRGLPGADALEGWDMAHNGNRLADPTRIHFGFRDGITKVTIKGIEPRRALVVEEGAPPHSNGPHEPGEFLLGHANNSGFNAWLLGTEPEIAPFFRNGSFGAFRKMQQDEGALLESVARWSRALGWSQDAVLAKLCGRWPDGSLLTDDLPPGRAPMPLRPNGKPDFQALDRQLDYSRDGAGFACPFAAHIRRMNPRQDPVVPLQRRPLIRRGMPYGLPFNEAPNVKERGLLGVFFCASLEDQFETLLGDWGNRNPMGPDNRSDIEDPLAGSHEDPRRVFDIPRKQGAPARLDGFQPFVTTRGTLYAFYPSRTALRVIAGHVPHEAVAVA